MLRSITSRPSRVISPSTACLYTLLSPSFFFHTSTSFFSAPPPSLTTDPEQLAKQFPTPAPLTERPVTINVPSPFEGAFTSMGSIHKPRPAPVSHIPNQLKARASATEIDVSHTTE